MDHGLRRVIFTTLTALAAATNSVRAAEPTGGEFFEKNIRPLFASRCFACHSTAIQAMGGLRLDTREAIEKGGNRGPAIVSGKPAESLLLRVINHSDASLKMPPSGKLKDAEVAAVAQWIAMGAPWGLASSESAAKKKYWAFVPPAASAVPQVRDTAWVKSPIDAFILAPLEAKGLAPAAPAAKRALIRRASFDLTGLPPSPAEISAFLADDRPGAFARLIDRLLESPRYGERWGRHWLDVARYADSNGLDENLVYKNAYRYRDYVIQAFNKDKPYDLFVKEQLAGDLLPESTDLNTMFERWTATGFLTLGAKMLAEDDPVKMEMDIVDEQLDTATRAFMGMTVGCARCHDHKFDPIPTADYYAMAGIFKSSKTMENFKVVAKWHEFVLADKENRERLAAHEAKIAAKGEEIDAVNKVENERLAASARGKIGAYLLAANDVMRYDAIVLKPFLEGGGDAAKATAAREAGSFDCGNAPRKLEKGKPNAAEGAKGPFAAEYDLDVARGGDYQLDFLEEETGGGTVDIHVNGVLLKKGATAIANRVASPEAGGWSVAGIFPFRDGRNTIRLEHKSRFPYFEKLLLAPHRLPARTEVPKPAMQVADRYGVNPGFLDQWIEELGRSKGAPHSVLFAWHAFGAASLKDWTSPASKLFADRAFNSREDLAAHYSELFARANQQWIALPDKSAKDAALPDASLEAIRQLIYEKAGPLRAPDGSRQYFPQAARDEVVRLEAERKQLEESKPDLPRAMGVGENSKVADLPIHIRGSHWTLGKEVPRGFLQAVAVENPPTIPKDRSGRLQFAEWLTRPDHPLTSRVMVNRIWRLHFGKGIVPTVDNFGRLGEAPTNQPLLDWLAVEFVKSGWSVKQMHRTIMLSNAYQMGTAHSAKSFEADPENTLLWRMNRRRLEAEAIRDGIMSVSGDLNLSMSGTLLKYKDRQYVADTDKRGGVDYTRNVRAVYIPVIRSSMYEMFTAFDLPDPATSNGDRNSTVIAPQALFMMNDTVPLRHSRALAEKILAQADLDDASRVRGAYERILGRPAQAGEVDRALTFIAQVGKSMADRAPAEAERRAFAWQSFIKALMASNEFIYLN